MKPSAGLHRFLLNGVTEEIDVNTEKLLAAPGSCTMTIAEFSQWADISIADAIDPAIKG